VPEASVDVALVGPDEEPDGYGRLELQTAHRLCPNTGVLNRGWKITLRHQMHPRLATIYWLLATIYLLLSTSYSSLVTMHLLLATMYLLLASMFLLWPPYIHT